VSVIGEGNPHKGRLSRFFVGLRTSHPERRSVIIDLSDRKRAEQAEMLLKERLVAAVESVQDPFSIHDASDRLVLCNSAFRRS
jgi:PAS domain-containing protein